MKKTILTLSAAGFAAIMLFEGCRLNAYKDPAGIWTIGYGSTYHADGSRVKAGDSLATKDDAVTLFRHTMKAYEDAVNQLVMVPINQNQYDALVSFAYNAGTHALGSSSLLKDLNAGNYQAAADQFLVWDKITNPHTGEKEVCEDLAIRRKKERLTFLKPIA